MNEALTKEAEALAVRARGLEVVDQASAARAAELVLAGKELIKRIKDFFTSLKKPLDEAKQKLISAERSELIQVEPYVSSLSERLAAWRLAEEVKRKEAESERRRQEEERRRLEEEAIRKVQEAERRAEEEKRMAEAEARRRELEALRKVEEAKTAAARKKAEEEARIARDEAARRRAEADRRAREEQDRILAAAAAEETKLEPMTVVPQAQKTEGLSFRDNWTYEIISEAMIPREYCIPDWVRIGRLAKVEKANLENVVPGVRGVNKPSMAKRPTAPRS